MFGDYLENNDYKMLKIYLLGFILTMGLLYASFSKPPVDEGLNTIRSGGHIKGVTFENSTKLTNATIYLSKETSIVSIIFKEVSFVPLICKIKRDDKEVWSSQPQKPINSKESRGLIFEISKEKLQEGDIIIILNNQDNIIKEIKVER